MKINNNSIAPWRGIEPRFGLQNRKRETGYTRTLYQWRSAPTEGVHVFPCCPPLLLTAVIGFDLNRWSYASLLIHHNKH